jgi:hypothetical protein
MDGLRAGVRIDVRVFARGVETVCNAFVPELRPGEVRVKYRFNRTQVDEVCATRATHKI